jgi:hypothetical protein
MTFFEQKIREQTKLSNAASIERFTIATLIEAVLAIDCDEDARAFYRGYLAWLAAHLPEDAENIPNKIACDNIGWCFGEGMSRERIAMWRRTTPAAHPTLPITEDYRPTAEECFETGLRLGRKLGRS